MLAIRLFLLLLLLPFCGKAQKYFTTHFRLAEGLPSEEVRATIRGKYGFLWVATDGGLLRFDGRSFINYKRVLDSHYIKALLRAPDSTLLMANDVGVFSIEEKPDTAYLRCLLPAQAIETDTALFYPNGLYASRAGALWISQPNGAVACWREGRLRFYRFGASHEDGGSGSGFHFAENSVGDLYAAASTGQFYWFDPEGDEFVRIPLGRPMEAIHCLLARSDTLWMGGSGLYRALMKKNRLEGEKYFSTGEHAINSLAEAGRHGRFFVGTRQSGLYRAQFAGGRLVFHKVFGSNDPHRINQLPYKNIHQVYLDEGRNIWLSTSQGLGLLQSRFFETVFGLANNNTFALLPLDKGEVLVSFGDVYEINREGTDFFGRLLPQIGNGFVTGLARRGDKVWISTADAEMFSFSNGRLRREADFQERGAGIFYLYADRAGGVWFCQAPRESPIVGVARLQPDGTVRYYEEGEGLDNRILVVKESARGRIYAAGIGPETYLYRYQPENDAFINLSLPLPFSYSQAFEVHDMAIDQRGIVWLGTTDGLLRYDLERIQRIGLGELTNTEIRSLAAMEGGGLWLATDTEGLLYYKDGAFTVFDEESGLPSRITAYRCLSLSASGRIWVGTAEGTVHSRDHFPQPEATAAPVLQSMLANGQRIYPMDALEASNNSDIYLRWATPAFPGYNVHCEYRLLGSPDSAWASLGTQTELALQGIRFGDYRLELRARRGGGYEWSAPLSIPVAIRRPWHRRWWAVLLFIGLGSFSLYYLIQFNVGRLIRRIRVLERDLAAREKEIERQEGLLRQQSRAMAAQAEGLQAAEEELSQQQAEMASAASNMSLLHQLISQIPRNSSWKVVVEALAGSLEHPLGIDAFELGWNHGDEIRFRGYVKRYRAFTHRSEEFSDKTSLPVWALMNKKAVIIRDYRVEQGQYIEPQDDYQYHSALLLPFEVVGKQPLVLCAYGIRKNAFDERDRQMLQILVDYLSIAIVDRLE